MNQHKLEILIQLNNTNSLDQDKIVELLIKHGANVNARAEYNMTVLHAAAYEGNYFAFLLIFFFT